jgi:hypothetical protein
MLQLQELQNMETDQVKATWKNHLRVKFKYVQIGVGGWQTRNLKLNHLYHGATTLPRSKLRWWPLHL